MRAFSLLSFTLVSIDLSAQVPAPGAGDTVRYSVVMSGRVTGTMKSWRAADGAFVTAYEFNDRGRGPALTERIVLDRQLQPTRLEVAGRDYLKNEVSERFAVENGRANWSSDVERGNRAGGGFFLSFYGVPEEMAVLARALLASSTGTLPLLPAGEARIERVGTRDVVGPGGRQNVTHYQIEGLGLTATPVWLDAQRRLFASGSTWLMVVREGFERVIPDLAEVQRVTASAKAIGLAQTLARRPKGFLVLRGANTFDAESGRMRPRTSVVIMGNRIIAVGPDDSVSAPNGALVIDLRGKALFPGMIDMHTHIQDEDGLLQIANGVTTVRDLANDTDELLARRQRFDAGTFIGPRIVLAGFMDGPGPFAGPTKVLVSTEDEARAAVNRYADLDYRQIKVYSSIKPELVPAIVDQAHRRGLRVSGHVPAFMTADQVVRAGFDELQHANFLFLNFWGDSVKDTRTPLRFTAVAEKAATLDLASQRVSEFVQLLATRGTVIDPTLNVFESMFTARKGMIDPAYAPVAMRVPPAVRRGLLGGGLPVAEGADRRYRDSFAALLRMVKLMYDAGVPIVAGTDAFAGFAYHRELELYEKAGIPAAEVMRIATIQAATVAQMDDEIGSIAAGKLADLVVFDGNPAQRVSDVRRVSLVIKDGVVHDAAALLSAVGIRSPTPSAAAAPAADRAGSR